MEWIFFGSSINTYCSGGLHLSKNECDELDNEWVYNHENFKIFGLKSNFELILDEIWAEMKIFSYEITKKNHLCFLYFYYYYWKYF